MNTNKSKKLMIFSIWEALEAFQINDDSRFDEDVIGKNLDDNSISLLV